MKEKLEQEISSMQRTFPQFELKMSAPQIRWIGAIHTVRNNFYATKILYPEDYPNNCPEVRCIGAEILGEVYRTLPWFSRRPMLIENETTLSVIGNYELSCWNPSSSTAADVLTLATKWYTAYEVYVFDGDLSFV